MRTQPNPAPPATAPEAPEVSVVMPCLNEAKTIATCIDKALRGMAEAGVSGEVVIGDNGSTDGSQAIAEAAGARVVAVSERGYGAALQGGIRAARGRFIIMGDADDSYDFLEVPKFIERWRAGFDYVQGCRLPRGGGTVKPGAMPPLHQYFGTPGLTLISRVLFGTRFHDNNCGMRGFTREAFERMGLQSPGMEFATEMMIKGALSGLNATEVPITLHPDGRDRAPHLRTWRDGWRHLRFMLLFSPNWLFLYPGIILALLGLATVAVLAAGTVSVGGAVLNVNSQIAAAATGLFGLQLASFGLAARGLAVREGLLADRLFAAFTRSNLLEWGLLAGFLFVLAGVASIAVAFSAWQDSGFGPLADSISRTLMIPGAVSFLAGLQLISASFLLGMIGFQIDRSRSAVPGRLQ